jgi:hypothetical protein
MTGKAEVTVQIRRLRLEPAVRESVATNSGLNRSFGGDRQFRLLPGVEPSHYINYTLKAGPLQQAARDHAAIASLAVNGNGEVAIDFGRRDFEVIQRPP